MEENIRYGNRVPLVGEPFIYPVMPDADIQYEGQKLESAPSSEILKSIFQKESLLHNGAILISQGEIMEVACYLPLTPAEGLPKEWGTRHRAAVGLSERCDAWVVVVSEERGKVSLARKGQMIHVENPQALYQLIREALAASGPLDKTWKERIRYLLLSRWRTKLATLCLVSFSWLILAVQQDFEVKLQIPLRTKGLPSQMEIVEPLNANIQVTLRGFTEMPASWIRKKWLLKLISPVLGPGT